MPPVDTFWSTGGVGGGSMLQGTPGDAYTDPYTILPGTTDVDYPNPQVWVDASLIFGELVEDPDTGLYPDRPDFDTATLADFMLWHSQHQAEYIKEKGTFADAPFAGVTDPPDPLPERTRPVYYVDFGAETTLVLGQDGRTVYHLEALKLSDIATMPLADQEALAGLKEFQDQAARLLVRPTVTVDSLGNVVYETVEDVRTEMLAKVEALISAITAATNYDAGDRDAFLRGFLYDGSLRVEYYPHFFVEQLKLYELRLEQMALFAEGRINEFLTGVTERFERIKSYHDVSPETNVSGSLTKGVNAIDGGDTMANGLGIFVEMESQLFQIALARAYVTTTGTLVEPVKGKLMLSQQIVDEASYYDPDDSVITNKKFTPFGTFLEEQATDIYDRLLSGESQQRFLDGPNLIFVLQTFANYEAEAEAQIESEVLQQQSALLKDYSRMQEQLNNTLKKFEPVAADDSGDPPPEEQLAFLGLSFVSELDADQKRIAAMFDKTASGVTGNTYHPIESEKSAGEPSGFRPVEEIASGTSLLVHKKSIWDALSVNLGEASKIISQSSQIQMDEVNKLSQQKNRHYELGSNVLNKLTELLREITS